MTLGHIRSCKSIMMHSLTLHSCRQLFKTNILNKTLLILANAIDIKDQAQALNEVMFPVAKH